MMDAYTIGHLVGLITGVIISWVPIGLYIRKRERDAFIEGYKEGVKECKESIERYFDKRFSKRGD